MTVPELLRRTVTTVPITPLPPIPLPSLASDSARLRLVQWELS